MAAAAMAALRRKEAADAARRERERVENGQDRELGGEGSVVGGRASPDAVVKTEGARQGWVQRQERVRLTYTTPRAQYAVAALIFANFLTTITEKQIDPFSEWDEPWTTLEIIYNCLFTIELIANAVGHWQSKAATKKWWSSGWNVFDAIVVTAGILTMCVTLPDSVSLIRNLRAFRVFRLFKRIKSLNKIISSLARAMPGVRDAFIVMLLVMCIYAILAVEFYGTFGRSPCAGDSREGSGMVENPDGSCYTYLDMDGNPIESLTSRQNKYGDDYYGNFIRALFTLFQVMTGESWAEAIARPGISEGDGRGGLGMAVGFYYISFILVTQIVLVNVVVAVLLEKMVEETPEESDEGEIPVPTGLTREEWHEIEEGFKKISTKHAIWNVQNQVNSLASDLKLIKEALNIVDTCNGNRNGVSREVKLAESPGPYAPNALEA